MFFDGRINACTHENLTNMQLFLSSSFSIPCLLFFALFYYSVLCLKFERGGNPGNPLPPDPPMMSISPHVSCYVFSAYSATVIVYIM